MREVGERFEPLLATFEATDDQLGLGRLWRLRGLVHWIEARSARADTAWQRAAQHSRRAGDEPGWSEALNWLASSAHNGPTPAAEAIARCESIRSQLCDHPRAQAMVQQPLAALRAMRGEIEPAKRLLADTNATIAEFGVSMHTAVSHHEPLVFLLAGDPAGAEAILRAAYEQLEKMGEKALLADTAAMLAEVLCEQGLADEAWAYTQEAEAGAAGDDLSAQMGWRMVRARLLAKAGHITEAKQISAEAVELAARTDWLSDHADALLSQGEVHRIAGEPDVAAPAIQEAIALYERKGHAIGAQRARSTLAEQIPV
jgi:tetratricopeptide (TPR) repeat protein